MEVESDAIDRATATNPKTCPSSRRPWPSGSAAKYRVAPEPLGALVAEAYDIGARTKLDPTLILAIMAVESGFNPFAQSAVGRPGPDAGHDRRAQRQVRELWRQARRV
jgi:soluble lytic murein transglycosylase-like protein